MPDKNRVTVYLDPDVHRALRLKAAEVREPVSDLINAAVKRALASDPRDIAIVRERAAEPALSLAGVILELKRRGRIS